METSFTTTVSLASGVGIKLPNVIVRAPRPIMTTTFTLEGIEVPQPPFVDTKILEVSTLTDFTFIGGTTSTEQTVYVLNKGTGPVNISKITYTYDGVNVHIKVDPSSLLYRAPGDPLPPLQPNTIGTFTVAYSAIEPGNFSNWIVIESDCDQPYYQIVTNQNVQGDFFTSTIPNGYTTNLVEYCDRTRVEYTIVSVVNGVIRDDLIFNYTYTLEENKGWRVVSTTTNSIALEFSAIDVDNVNGIYDADLGITVNGYTKHVHSIANLEIDMTKNYNLSKWSSPISSNNSIIGISYDVINDIKTLTIGVGSGGDNINEYTNGGSNLINLINLGVGSDKFDVPYVGWSEVYRFSNLGSGSPKVMFSNEFVDGDYLYKQKYIETLNYGSYFGAETSTGSMFIVEDDGLGNITIYINYLREGSTDVEIDKTLKNLSRAFHYYSSIDIGGRILNKVQYPFNDVPPISAETMTSPYPPGETKTRLFRGFTYKTKQINSTSLNISNSGTTTLTLSRLSSIALGDIIFKINDVNCEREIISVTNINDQTSTITLSKGLPITVNQGDNVVFKNPILIETTKVDIPT